METLQQLITQSQPVQKTGMDSFANELLESIGSGLSDADQEWFIQNLPGFPEYLRSSEGSVVMSLVVECYRQSKKKLHWDS